MHPRARCVVTPGGYLADPVPPTRAGPILIPKKSERPARIGDAGRTHAVISTAIATASLSCVQTQGRHVHAGARDGSRYMPARDPLAGRLGRGRSG